MNRYPLVLATSLMFLAAPSAGQSTKALTGNVYYFNLSGSDTNDGSLRHPFQSIRKLNSLALRPGDEALLKGGDNFRGSIMLDSTKFGAPGANIKIGSYGPGRPTVSAGDSIALLLLKTKFVVISNLEFKGSGRKAGNTTDGVRVDRCSNIQFDDINVSGFQKVGLFIYASSYVRLRNVFARDNGAAGISVDGPYANKASNYDVYIGFCRAENNPGDPTNLTNHSGNGIVVGNCSRVIIEYCTATNNGWDMPRIGNGPVGIWAYEADSVVIQHCLSYRNKTSVGGADGGGFDLDGGVTNSLVQYCLSYENQGAGYSIFQYLYATPWYNNVFRFNISENDGSVSDAQAGVHIWNSSRDSNQFYNCLFYNNTIYNDRGAAISFSELSEHRSFSFYNNIFVAKDSLIKGKRSSDRFVANDWWSLDRRFDLDGLFNFTGWVKSSGQEKFKGKIVGDNVRPVFLNPGHTTLTSASQLHSFRNYRLATSSSLQAAGIRLRKTLRIDPGNADFLSTKIINTGVGACLE